MDSRFVQSVAAGVVLAAVTLGCFRQLAQRPRELLVGPQRQGWNDLTSYFVACRKYPRLCWERFGQWPWWNPYKCGGVPYVGNPQSALFYPPNWICWWIDARDALSWLLVGHHWFAGVGAYLLGRRYGLAWLAAVTAGAVFLAAPYLVAHTGEGHYAQICAVAWMPWAFLAYESLRAGKFQRGGIAGLAVVLAMSFFAGHVQEIFFLAVILTSWLLVDAVAQWRAGDSGECRRLLLNWLVVGLGTAALVAVDLLPMLVYTRETVRAVGLTVAEAGAISLGPTNLLQLINPFALGGPQSYGGRDKFFWETVFSFGLTPLALAAIGVATAWKRYPVRRLVWSWLIAVAFAFGGPLFYASYWLVPGVALFRAPARVLFFCSLATAVLAGMGVDSLRAAARDWFDRRLTAFRWSMLAAGAACLVVIALNHWEHVPLSEAAASRSPEAPTGESAEGQDRTSGETPGPSLAELGVRRTFGSRTPWGWLLASVALAYAAVAWPTLTRPAVVGLLVLCVVQLSSYAGKLVITRGIDELCGRSAIAQLAADEPVPSRVLARQELLSDCAAWESGLAMIEGYDPVPLKRHVDLFAALTGEPDAAASMAGQESPDPARLCDNVLDLMSVRMLVLDPQRGKPPERLGWRPVAMGAMKPSAVEPGAAASKFYSLYENPNALPRAYVLGHIHDQQLGDDAAGVLAGINPRETVLLDHDVLPQGARAHFAPAEVVEYTPNRVTIDAELPAPGYLVLGDTWFPGWSAEAAGQPLRVLVANVAFRAVPLEAGSHRVVFRYVPVGLIPGAIISAAAWLLVLASLIGARMHRG